MLAGCSIEGVCLCVSRLFYGSVFVLAGCSIEGVCLCVSSCSIGVCLCVSRLFYRRSVFVS